MRALVVMAACLTLASAELYKETQDFQYSRTSSDDGEKKGYYGSQTGNMGGNFEVSHNMDHMAKGQMHQLIHTVSDQLGMEQGGAGSGRPVAGSVYGSASTSGNTFGAKKTSVNAQDLASGGSWSNQYDTTHNAFGSGSRAVESQHYGSNSQSQHAASGQRTQGNLYTGDGTVYRSDLQGGRVAAAPSNSHVASAQQGSTWSSYGETASQSGSNRQAGDRVYVIPASGVRESGAVSGSQYSQQGTYQGGRAVNYGTEGRPAVVVQPGSTVRLAVRPGQSIPIRIPISATQHGFQTSNSGQNTGYATNSYDRTLSSADLTNTQRAHDMAVLNAGTAGSAGSIGNTDASRRTGSVGDAANANGMKSYESSYSYQKEWESHGGAGGQRNSGDRTIGQVADFGAAAQNRDKLFVGGLEVAGEDNGGSTTYNSGSRVASTGQHYAGSNTYRESKGESSRNDYSSGSRQNAGQIYSSDSSRQAAGQTYNYGGAAYDTAGQTYNAGGTRRGDEETYSTRNSHQTAGQAYNAGASQQDYRAASQVAGSDTNRLITAAANQPKSFGSSFSYQKSWEKHGDPYVIQPPTDSYGSSLGVQNADLSSTLHQENTGYAAGHRAGSSTYGGSSQYDSSRSAGSTAGGASHTGDLSVNMAAMQDQLRSQMGQACGPTCNTGGTKGYSATYSYSRQRSYGGSADTAGNDEERHRYKRHLGVGYGRHDYHNHHDGSFQTPTFSSHSEMPTFSSHSHQSGFQPKFTSSSSNWFHEGHAEIPSTSHSYSSSFSSNHGQGSGKGALVMKMSPSFSGNFKDYGEMEKEMEKELEKELKKAMEKHRGELESDKTHRTFYSQTSRHYSTGTGKGSEFFMKQSGEADPAKDLGQETLTVSSGKLDMSGKKLEKPEHDKATRTRSFTSTTYYSSNGHNGKGNKGEEADLEVEAQSEFGKSGHRTQSFSDSDKLLTSNKKLEDLDVDSDTGTYRTRHYTYFKNNEPITPKSRDVEGNSEEELDEDSGKQTQGVRNPHQSVSNKEFNGKLYKDSGFSVSSSHFTTSSQHSSGDVVGKSNEDVDEQTQDLGQETQDFTSTYGNLQGKPNLSGGRNPYLTTNNQYTSDKKPKSQENYDVGQETQGFSSTYGNLQAKPHISSGSFHVTDEEPEDMGQETQGFSGNLFSGSNSQYGSGKKPKTPGSEDAGQETQDFSSTHGNLQAKPHHSSGSFHMTDEETEDMGQETQGFSGNLFSGSNSQYGSGKKPKTQVNEDVGQETQDFTSTYGNLQAKPHLSTGNLQMTGQETQGFSGNLFLGSSSQYTSGNKPKTQANKDVGQETQDFSSTYGNLHAKPQFPTGNLHATEEETEDVGQETQDFTSTYGNLQAKPHLSTGNLQMTGQETQGFSGNLFLESNSQYTSGNKPKTQVNEDVGQETQDFSSTYGNLQAQPQFSTGNLHMTGQETEDLGQETQDFTSTHGNLQAKPHLSTGNLQMTGQETQGFSGNLFLGSSSQYTSGKKPKTIANEDVGQETQDFSSTYGNLQAQPQFSTGNLHMTGQETEDLGQETQDFTSTHGNLQGKPHLSTGNLQMTGQETQGFSGNLFLGSSNQYTSGKKPKTIANEDVGQETQDFSSTYGNLQAKPQFSSGNLYMTGQESEDLGQETQDFTNTHGNLQAKPHLSTGSSPMTGQETQGFSGNLFLGSSSQYTNPKTQDVGQETQDFSSTYGNLQAGSLYTTGQETEDLGQQTEDLGQETQNYATSYGLTANSQQSAGKLHVGQETQDLGQQTQGFTQNFGNAHSSGSSRHSTGSLHMTGQETQDLGQTYSFGQETSGFSSNGKSYSQSNMGTGPKLQFSNQQGNVGQASSQNSNTNKQKTDHINDKDLDSHLDDLLALLGTDMDAAIGKETEHTVTSQTNKLDKNTHTYHYSSTGYNSKPKPLAGFGVNENKATEPKDTPFKVNFTMEYQGGRANDRVIPGNPSGPREKPVIHSGSTMPLAKPSSMSHTQENHKPSGLNTQDNKESSFLETYKYNSGKITENAHSGYYKADGHQADQVNAGSVNIQKPVSTAGNQKPNTGSGHIQKPVSTVGNQKLNFAQQSYDDGQQVEETADWGGEQVAVQHAHVQQQYGQMHSGSLLENHNQDDFYQQSSYGAMQHKQDSAQPGLQAGHYQSAGRLNGQFTIGAQQQVHSQNAATPEKHVATTTQKPEITTTEEPGIWRRAKDKAKSWFS